ncbi:LuxR C-terminal-related transcriptional regulator [Pontibacter ramchanderi]|uniref:PAS domain-containing protein n=1 Tax=Pontibacter ramchanderi TaxID=1179743 RepID=A0A2N3V296_9BACT|nr:LuxR C-terminal-related transcriptional regulator [Pontibacter ramchanderi]PKV75751.1 PAS domain-containing protein [Pontibacter ramchanderi]
MPEQSSETDKIAALESEIRNLREKCAFLEKVVHEVPANIYISNLQEGVIWCNRTNEETLGYTLEEINEMGGMAYLQAIVHPDDLHIPEDSITHYQHFDGAEFGGLFRAKHKHESQYKWFLGWAKAFNKSPKGEVKEIICVDVDMSPRMNTEEQLTQALRENLKQKNRILLRSLRKREIEILELICKGCSTREIAERLFISPNTVSTHRKSIQRKLGTSNVADLVSLGKEAGIG